MNASDEENVRRIVGRGLTPTELETFDTLDAISSVVEAMAGTIAKRDRILAMRYLRERVPAGDYADTLSTLDLITEKYPR